MSGEPIRHSADIAVVMAAGLSPEERMSYASKLSPAPPKRMNFRKSSKRPLTPPPHFRKIILQIFPKFPRPPSELFRKFIRFGGGRLPWGKILFNDALYIWELPVVGGLNACPGTYVPQQWWFYKFSQISPGPAPVCPVECDLSNFVKSPFQR